MNDQDFTATIVVNQTPSEVFAAINDVRAWWGVDVEGRTDEVGAQFIFRGQDVHYSQIVVEELVPAERISWRVGETYMNFVENQTEWTGSRISFEIEQLADGTQVRFSHHGLVPSDECFDTCSNAWGFFITASLKSFITTGEGQPMPIHPHRIEAAPGKLPIASGGRL